MIVWLVSDMRSNSSSSLSLHQCSCLKNVRIVEHMVLAGDQSAYHQESEFLPFNVCKLVRWSLFIVCPCLFFATLDHKNINNQVWSLLRRWPLHSLELFSALLSCNKTSRQDVQYVLRVREEMVLTTSDARVDWPTRNRVRKYTTWQCSLGNWSKFEFPQSLLDAFFHPRNRLREKLDARRQHVYQLLIFMLDFYRSPDVWALGWWDPLRPDDDDAFCCSLFGIQQ